VESLKLMLGVKRACNTALRLQLVAIPEKRHDCLDQYLTSLQLRPLAYKTNFLDTFFNMIDLTNNLIAHSPFRLACEEHRVQKQQGIQLV
jgi:hypothetical protein